jgi:hypothetical protein
LDDRDVDIIAMHRHGKSIRCIALTALRHLLDRELGSETNVAA